ncbi:MAG: tetratricopeptide repeat protein [Sandaracinus sp.]|nr:tetratricopeptide repeat protein [Sandaracinus sp.]
MSNPKADPRAALAASQRAHAAGDIHAALDALADALASDPVDTAALQHAYAMLQRLPNALQATAPQRGMPLSRVALHALALAIAHDWSPAFEMLFRLGTDDPRTPYLQWAESWCNSHPSALLLDLGRVGPALMAFADKFEDPIDAQSPWWKTLQAGTAVMKRLSETFVDNRGLKTVYVKLLRRGGRFDEALAIAREVGAQDPYFGHLMTAWTYRDMDRPHDAIASFHAARAAKDDPSVLLDVGDLHLNHGEYEQAHETYRQVPQGEGYDWAVASYWAAHHLATRDPQSLANLTSMVATNPRAKELHAWIHAYAEVMPTPRDLTAGIVRDVLGHLRRSPGSPDAPAKLDVNITSIESPSVSVAFEVAKRMTGGHAALNVNPEKEAEPDPRQPLITAIGRGPDAVYQQFPIWVYEGARPRINAPVPPPAAQQAVARLASTPFDWAGWQRAAAEAAPSLRGQVVGLVCTLVHPPTPPQAPPSAWSARSTADDVDPVEWTWKCQVAAALLVTKLDAGWNGSERRSGLCAMVHGPIDWTISAALPCLGLVYAECPEARDELRQIFDALRQRVPDIGYACYRAPLEAVTMRLPDVDEKARRQAWTRLVKATQKPFLG